MAPRAAVHDPALVDMRRRTFEGDQPLYLAC